MNLANINDDIHPIRLEYEIAKNTLKYATMDYKYTIEQARSGNETALLCLVKYRNAYDDANGDFEKAKTRFVSIGGKPDK